MWFHKKEKAVIPYDSKMLYPVIMSSICTGEKVAGFKNKKNGHFTEVMLIKTKADEDRFKKMYGLDDIKVEY